MKDHFQSSNPATGEAEGSYPVDSTQDVRTAVSSAHKRFLEWRRVLAKDRSALLLKVADGLEETRDALAGVMAREMGKPVSQGRAEIEKCAWVCRYYAEEGEAFLKPRRIETADGTGIVSCQPLGVVLAVMPWNFPFWQVFRFAAPNLIG